MSTPSCAKCLAASFAVALEIYVERHQLAARYEFTQFDLETCAAWARARIIRDADGPCQHRMPLRVAGNSKVVRAAAANELIRALVENHACEPGEPAKDGAFEVRIGPERWLFGEGTVSYVNIDAHPAIRKVANIGNNVTADLVAVAIGFVTEGN